MKITYAWLALLRTRLTVVRLAALEENARLLDVSIPRCKRVYPRIRQRVTYRRAATHYVSLWRSHQFFSFRVSWLAVSRQAVPLCSCCFFLLLDSPLRFHSSCILLVTYVYAVCCNLQLPAICFTSFVYNFLGNRIIFNKERRPGDQRQSWQDWLREFGEA